MEIKDYVRVLRKRWLSIVVITALALAGAAAATLNATPLYQAQTRLFVSAQGTASSNDLLQGNVFAQQRVQSYVDIVSTETVLGPVVQELDLPISAGALAGQVTADAPVDTVTINITATDASPERAAQIANAVGASLITVVTRLEQPNDAVAVNPVRITTTQPAVVPSSPTSPNTRLNLVVGLLLGLLVGVGVAALRESLDTALRGEADLAGFGTPVLAGMTFDEEAARSPLVVFAAPHSQRSEAFRRLRTNFQFATAANNARSVVVTSALEGEGKSTTVINLALALSEAGVNTVLVDADLRRPSIASYLGLEGAAGLTTVLVGRASYEEVLQPWGDHDLLSVLAAGDTPPNPSELLASGQMHELVGKLEQDFDVVLFDGAPLLAVTDSAALAARVDGAIMVVQGGRTKKPQFARALQSLTAVEARVLGAVLTMLPSRGPDAYQTYPYGSTPPRRQT